MKKTICTILLTLIGLKGFNQINFTSVDNSSDSLPVFVHKLGLHAGTTSGLGLSYKLLINNKLMIQTVSLPVASRTYKYINSGLSLKYKFRDYEKWDFYAFAAGNHNYIESTEDVWSGDWMITEIVTETTYINNYNGSAGIAFEYGQGEFFKLGVQIGYGIYNIGDQDWRTNLSIGSTIDFSLNSK